MSIFVVWNKQIIKMEKKEGYKVISHMFKGTSEYNGKILGYTYEITFNKSLEHTGRFSGIEDGLNTYCKKECRTDIRQRTLFDKLRYWFICRKKGHTVSRVHPKYPSQYCSVCNKHRSEF